jgi:glycine betaine/proline transport system substrate-binding protein
MKRTGTARLLAVIAVVGLVFTACSGGSGGSPSAASKGTVKIAINEWVGAEANVAVVSNLLTTMGYTVETKTLAEEIAWQGFDTGEIDVILENWGHPDLEKLYFQDKKKAEDAGPNGVTGIIGWYVPGWMVDKYPDITDWNNLNKYASLFKTSESGDKGQFLASDPTFVTNDEALIANLKLDYKAIYSGSEAASVTAFQQADKDKTPLIGYFYTPQWLNAEVKLVKINFPPYTAGCDADPKTVACDYPPYTLNKAISVKFATDGGDAATLVKNFKWSNADQNTVADYKANKGMTIEAAAQKWIDENQATWKAWMP